MPLVAASHQAPASIIKRMRYLDSIFTHSLLGHSPDIRTSLVIPLCYSQNSEHTRLRVPTPLSHSKHKQILATAPTYYPFKRIIVFCTASFELYCVLLYPRTKPPWKDSLLDVRPRLPRLPAAGPSLVTMHFLGSKRQP